MIVVKRKNYFLFVIAFVLFVLSSSVSAKTIRYVKVSGTGDGSSWATASSNIQTMIDNSISGDEVWVAKGTYYPTTETIARDPRSRTFLVKSGVNLYGGFAGTETAITQRELRDLDTNGIVEPWEFSNSTILNGDNDGVADVWTKKIDSDGFTWSWTIIGNENNCYRVVSANSAIDGFTIYGGNGNSSTVYNGGGIYSSSSVTNCTVSNCSAGSGGGIYSSSTSSVTNCIVSNCYARNSNGGGGIYGYSSSIVANCTVSNCSSYYYGGGISSYSSVTNCTVSNCSADSDGGGIYSPNSSSVTNCTVFNCSAGNNGGGIYSSLSSSSVTNCTVSNCSAGGGGGGIYSLYSSSVTNCTVSNCFAASSGGGIYGYSVTNCVASNNKTNGTIGSGVSVSNGFISPAISVTYKQPTSFVGVAANDNQKAELLTADWRLKEGSPCINAGSSANIPTLILSGRDLDNNARVAHGAIDIGAYEYIVPTVNIPVAENFNNLSGWNSSNVFYNSAQLNGNQNIKWDVSNQKAVFSWQTNLTSTYSEPFFSYQVDATNTPSVFLRYDMYFEAYAGVISPLGTEKLNVEYSTDLITWSTIATYSNANGTITNRTYTHDLSTKLAGKKFFIRFNANGANTNRLEKWEVDNVVINVDGVSAVQNIQQEVYRYSIINGELNIANLGQAATIQIFDINGKLLVDKTESQTAKFILSTQGIYLVKVTSDLGIENKKIVW